MKRMFSLLVSIAVLSTIPVAVAAQDEPVDPVFRALFETIFSRPDAFAPDLLIVILEDGSVASFEDDPTGGLYLVDFTGASPGLDDSNDGVDSRIDIVHGTANRVELTDEVLEFITPRMAGLGLQPGFFTAHDGTPPAFPGQSTVFGIETAEPIADEEEPYEYRASLSLQWNVTFTRSGQPVADTDDSNGGHNGSIDNYSSPEGLGTDAYDFPGGNFTRQPTEYFGRAWGNYLFFGGPSSVLEGAEGFELNFVDFPDFDSLELGDVTDFGTINVYSYAEFLEMQEATEEEEEVVEEEPGEETQEPADSEGTIEGETPPPVEEEEAEEPASVAAQDADGGSNVGIIVGAVVLVALGIVGLILLLRKKEEEECVPEAERLAAARAQVAIKETAVKKAREHLEYTLAHATEQAVQREVEARQRLAQTERELEEARDEERAAQHAYNVCMGLVPPTPEPEPEPEVTPPVAPPPRPEMPGPPPDAPTSVDESDTGRPGVSETTDQVTTTPPPPPPPPRKADCVDGQSREIEESKQSFTIPADGMVRLSIATEDGPLDDLEDAVSVTPIADMITEQIAELLAPDSLGVTAEALTPQSARSWQSAFEKMAATARTEVEVVIEYDLETVTLVCIRLEECVKGSWVTVGHRLEERSREKETVSARWETVGSGRPLGATFTVIKRELDKAAGAKGDMDRFSSACN